jgi:hypothetical protein
MEFKKFTFRNNKTHGEESVLRVIKADVVNKSPHPPAPTLMELSYSLLRSQDPKLGPILSL